jgi:hypothetical protein
MGRLTFSRVPALQCWRSPSISMCGCSPLSAISDSSAFAHDNAGRQRRRATLCQPGTSCCGGSAQNLAAISGTVARWNRVACRHRRIFQQRESDVPTVSMLTQQAATEAIQTLDPAAQQTVRNDSRECRNPMGFITVSTPGSSPRAIGSTPNRLQRQSPSRSRMAARIDGLKLAKAHFRLRHFMLCELLRTVRATVDRCAAPRPTKHPILISVNSIPFYRMSCYS